MSTTFTQTTILSVLNKARFFSQFGDEELLCLIDLSEVRSYKTDDIILEQDQQNREVYILLSGAIAIYSDDEFIITLEDQGDIVGEMSVITKTATTAKVLAVTDAHLFIVDTDNVHQQENNDCQNLLRKVFLDILTEKLTITTHKVRGFKATTEALSQKQLELARSETNLHHNEAILESILESMSDGVVVTDRLGGLSQVNETFRKMVGDIDIPVLIDQWPSVLGLYYSDSGKQYHASELPMNRIIRGEEVDSEEIYVKNVKLKEGIWLQASSRFLTIDGIDGSIGSVVVFRDFTKKKMEEIALIKAKEAAESLAKAKSNFLAVMSHELRTPLNGIIGMADLLAASQLDSDQQDLLGNLKSSGDELQQLLINIIDYSNLDTGNFKLTEEAYSFQTAVAEISQECKSVSKSRQITLEIDLFSDYQGEIKGNQYGVKQILRNLLTNAIKFSDHHSTVKIQAHQENIQGNRCIINCSIIDNGIGIAPEDMDKLFQPFSQIDSSYSRKFEGTGIGLSICDKLIKLMNGEIHVASELGKGSTFTFSFPTLLLAEKQHEIVMSSNKRDESVLKPDQEFASVYPKKILVVDDNLMNQKLISKLLKKLGYQPEIAGNGEEAVEATRKVSYDLVLMDLQMPIMDGIEATRIIQKEKSERKTPVIVALTANVSEEVKTTCLEVGMKKYLAKPVKLNELTGILKAL